MAFSSTLALIHRYFESDAFLLALMYLEDTEYSQDPRILARREEVQLYLAALLEEFDREED